MADPYQMPQGLSPLEQANWLSDYAQAYGGTWLGQQSQTANDEARRRIRETEDRQYQLQVQAAQQARDRDAATMGNYRAQQKYNAELQRIAGEKLKLDQERQQFDMQQTSNLNTATLTGMYNGQATPAYQQQQANITGMDASGNPTFARQQWQEQAMLAREQAAAQLTGPEDWLKYKQLTSGVAAGSPLTPGISNWQTGGQTGVNGFAQGQNPTPLTYSKIMTDMGVGGGGPMGTGQAGSSMQLSSAEQQLNTTANEFAKNPQMAAGNWWEQMDPDTQAMIKGAAEKGGNSWASTMDRFKKSRWGGSESSAAAA